MDLEPWNPWKELERVQAEIDVAIRSVLEKFHRVMPEKPIAFVPAFDIVESEDECRLYLSLPGMEEEDIDITVEGTQLIVRGEREASVDRLSHHLGSGPHSRG